MMNKKASALFFLMELLLIVVFIIAITSIAYKFATNDGKIRQFETYNLALFLERIPSIEGNFEYTYNLELPSSIEITNDTVYLDDIINAGTRYQETYTNPSEYKFEFKGENVTQLIFVKSGSTVQILTPEERNKITTIKYATPDKKVSFENNFVIKTNIESFDYIAQSFKTTVIEDVDSAEKINLLWYVEEKENSQKVIIYYSEDARGYAEAMYATLVDKLDGEVVIVPAKYFDKVKTITGPTIQIEIKKESINSALIELKELFDA